MQQKKVRFISKGQDDFFPLVKERVDQYFKDNNLSKNANWFMYLKSFIFLGGLVGVYLLILTQNYSLSVMLVLAIILGMIAAMIGFNVCHDAIHGSYSANPTVNKIFGHVFNIIGANASMWNITHNIIHHTYTNMPGHDEDIEVFPGVIRLSPEDKINKIQKYQHLYAFPIYCLASLSWVFKKDFVKFFKKRIGHYDNSKKDLSDYLELFVFKIVYVVIFIVIPLVVLDITWWQFLIGFVAMHLAEGFVLGIVFQLAHVVEGTDFPVVNAEGNIENAWAVHQMNTTANFASAKFWATFFCGGLNMQIEHHLFPKVCHVHYPKISKIVKTTALECGVPYIENKTFFSAVKSHYKMLKYFGIESQRAISQAAA